MTRYAMSRHRRNLIISIFTLVLAGLFVIDRTAVRPAWRQRQAQTQSQQTSADFEKYHAKQFLVVKVVDGDTLDINIPDADYNTTRIRLWGIDTPETKDPRAGMRPLGETGPMYYGKEASDYATKLALDKQITIYLDEGRNTRDKYHRLLAYIQLPDGKFLNEELLSEGYAYADLRFKHSFYNKYKQLEAFARSHKLGLWANVTFDQMPEWLQRERPELGNKK